MLKLNDCFFRSSWFKGKHQEVEEEREGGGGERGGKEKVIEAGKKEKD
jgi:hypothetical protein